MDVEHCRERDIDEPPQIPLAQAELEGEKKAPQEEAQAPQPSQANPPACGQGWRKPLTLFIGKCALKRAMNFSISPLLKNANSLFAIALKILDTVLGLE